MPDVLLYENEVWRSGFLRLAGIDEAGRGPLAGAVVAAAVIFDPAYITIAVTGELTGLTDSKALSERQRETYYQTLISNKSIEIGVGVVTAAEIDRINILKATHKAMAIAAREVKADYALVDGLPVKGLPCQSKSIVKGDALSISISAASIIAKVTRDRMMVDLDRQFPEYGFAKHKGYGTKQHLAALKKYGPISEHRKTFRPIAELDQLQFDI